jgi:transcriptional regulator with XRE-family HTH domain
VYSCRFHRIRVSIGWLAEIYFRDGRDAARTALEAVTPGELLEHYRVVRRGEQALRTVGGRRDRILYQSFNPPFWAWPYSILRCRFDPAEKERFMCHGGEEILLPTAGSVSYHFFWSAGQSEPGRKLLPSPVKPGSVIRIDPQIPHHTWAAGEEPAEAWMIIRDLTDNSAGTHLDLPRDVNLEMPSPRRQLTADELRHGERYALAAWGISEKIRVARLRAGISIRQLAAACQIDPAQLSRIETGSGASNVSLEVLLRIVRCLGVEIQELFSAELTDANDPFTIESIDRRDETAGTQPVLCLPRRHLLHLERWTLPEGRTLDVESQGLSGAPRSWIVLEGEAIFDLVSPSSGSHKELIDRDCVLHCRNQTGLTSIRALQSLELLQVTYSPDCPVAR